MFKNFYQFNFILFKIKIKGPTPFNNQMTSLIFFILFIFIGTFFFMNLFIGIIIFWFSKVERRFKNKFLTESQVRWIEFQKLILEANPKFKNLRPPLNSKIRMIFYNFVNSKTFETIIMIFIIFNVIVMASNYETASPRFLNILTILDYCLVFIFVIEMIVKIFALTLFGYFYEDWNKIDFFVVFISVFDLVFK